MDEEHKDNDKVRADGNALIILSDIKFKNSMKIIF